MEEERGDWDGRYSVRVRGWHTCIVNTYTYARVRKNIYTASVCVDVTVLIVTVKG